jgi:hypothetical protein
VGLIDADHDPLRPCNGSGAEGKKASDQPVGLTTRMQARAVFPPKGVKSVSLFFIECGLHHADASKR